MSKSANTSLYFLCDYKSFYRKYNNIKTGKTIITIAHRPSTINGADIIVDMSKMLII